MQLGNALCGLSLLCAMRGITTALDLSSEEYPLPSKTVLPDIGGCSIDWCSIIRKIRDDCLSLDVFASADGPQATLAAMQDLCASVASHPYCYNFLLCTQNKNKIKILNFFENGEQEDIPGKYKKILARMIEDMVYEQMMPSTAVLLSTIQFIEANAAKYIDSVKIGTYKQIFKKALLDLYPPLFISRDPSGIKQLLSYRKQLIECINTLQAYLHHVCAHLVEYSLKMVKTVGQLHMDYQRAGKHDSALNTFLESALAALERITVLHDIKEECIQIQFYSAAPCSHYDSTLMKFVMATMLQTSLGQELMKVRAYKSFSDASLTIYSLEPKNMKLKYVMLVTIPVYCPPFDIIETYHKAGRITAEQYATVSSSWHALKKIVNVCSSFKMEERFAQFVRYICSDGTFECFTADDKKKYLYYAALYIDALFCYRNTLVRLSKTLPELSTYINTTLLKSYHLENGFINIVNPELTFRWNDPKSFIQLNNLIEKAYNEFKEMGRAYALPRSLISTLTSQTEKSFLQYMAYLGSLVSKATDARTALQDAARAADLADKAAERETAREQREAKKLARAQKLEEEREQQKEQEIAASKTQKNRKRRKRRKQAARAKAEEQTEMFEVDNAIEEPEDGEDSEGLSQSDTAKEPAASCTASESPPSSSAPPSSPSQGYSLSSSSPAQNIPFRVLSRDKALLKLAHLLKDMQGLNTCNLHLSVTSWMDNCNIPKNLEKAYHCHDLIDFAAAFETAEEMARYFLVLVCNLPSQEYISLYAPATLHIADKRKWHIESGYLELGGFYWRIQYNNMGRRVNLHHLRLNTTEHSIYDHNTAYDVLFKTNAMADTAAGTVTADDIISPLRGFFPEGKDKLSCRLVADSVTGILRLIYYTQSDSGIKKISRILELRPLTSETKASTKDWACAQFGRFLDKRVGVHKTQMLDATFSKGHGGSKAS